MRKEPILLIAFYYPPYPKVGSRRWVKFAKYLNRYGANIHILAGQMDGDKESPWDEDAKEIEFLTKRVHLKYKAPYYKRALPNSLFSKVKWHLSKLIESNNYKKRALGDPNDNSEIYTDKFIFYARKLITMHNIKTVIFTASPFHLSYHISELKEYYPSVKFVFDMRDYWTDWMHNLEKEQLQHEADMERKTIMNSDIIISPAQKIINTLRLRYPEKENSLFVIPHAYDEDDFESKKEDISKSEKASDKVNLVYAGSMYPGMEMNMSLLAELLKVNTNIVITFYTFTKDYSNFFSEESIKNRVIYSTPLPMKKFAVQMMEYADAMLYMRSNLNNDNSFLSSKFYDFLPLRKPIIYMGDEGDALTFLLENKIGFHLKPDNVMQFENNLHKMKDKLDDFDITEYSFSKLTKRLNTLIED